MRKSRIRRRRNRDLRLGHIEVEINNLPVRGVRIALYQIERAARASPEIICGHMIRLDERFHDVGIELVRSGARLAR
ncbi:MAG: hypothetical protein HYU73_03040 [Betaproteobacteria bacterium]|nr:hypothetical protein [Betaproteobacteria bacterium]